MRQTCAAQLPSDGRCGKPATSTDPELRDSVCAACAHRLDQRRWHRSYYEAGRAIALANLGVCVTAISLHASEPSRTRPFASAWSGFSAEDRCRYLLAGRVADEYGVETNVLEARDPSIGALDLDYARRYARSLAGNESDVEAYLEVTRQEMFRMIEDRREAVDGLATALFERLRLNADETATLLARGKTLA